MTTLQLAQRLAPDLGEDDFSILSMDNRIQILDAMNAGIQRYHAKTTPKHRTITVSCLLSAPKKIDITVQNKTPAFSGYAANEEDLYCTLTIEGDPIPNQLVSSDQLFDYYTGSSGNAKATIYYDAIPLHLPIKRMVSEPVLVGACSRVLRRRDKAHWTGGSSRCHGAPTAYSIDYNAYADAGNIPAIIRLDSLPDKHYKIRFEVEMDALHLGLEHLEKPIDLPVRGSHIEAYLIPMVRAALTLSSKWKNDEKINLVMDQANTAERELTNETFVHTASSKNKIGTAYKY